MTRLASSGSGGSLTPATAPTLVELVAIFVRTGALAFGGGAATLAMLHDEFCVRRPLLSDAEFQLLFGLTRLLPGMNLLSLTVMLGHRFHGVVGALLSLLGLTVPSFAIILLGCGLLRSGHTGPALAGAVRGLSIGAAALLLDTGWRLCQGSLAPLPWRSRTLWVTLMLAALLLSRVPAISAAWLVLGGGLVGVLLRPLIQSQRP